MKNIVLQHGEKSFRFCADDEVVDIWSFFEFMYNHDITPTEQRDAEQFFCSVFSEKQICDVFRLRYIDGLIFEDIAKTIAYSRRQVHRLHQYGLGEIFKKLSAGEIRYIESVC